MPPNQIKPEIAQQFIHIFSQRHLAEEILLHTRKETIKYKDIYPEDEDEDEDEDTFSYREPIRTEEYTETEPYTKAINVFLTCKALYQLPFAQELIDQFKFPEGYLKNKLRVYAMNYNVLRIMSGSMGMAYST